jgi:hypothetical protein
MGEGKWLPSGFGPAGQDLFGSGYQGRPFEGLRASEVANFQDFFRMHDAIAVDDHVPDWMTSRQGISR